MKSEQETIQELLKQELDKNADRTIAEVEADKSLQDIKLPEGLDEGLAAKIEEFERQKAVREQLSDEGKEILRRGYEGMMLKADDGFESENHKEVTDKTRTVRFRKRRKMAFLLVAVVAALTLAMGMTSIGGKPFIPQLFEQMLAGRENVNIDTDGGDKVVSEVIKEDEIYQKIKDAFGFDAVEIRQLPEGTSFLEGNVDNEIQEAYLIYDYKGNIIEYRILANNRDKSFGYDVEDKLIEEYQIINDKVTINVKHYKILDSGEEIFTGHFTYKNINYLLRGAVSKDEFEKILKNIKFY